jgi:adenylylsulfate kinase
MTGLSGAGKTTLAEAVAERLHDEGFKIEIIDGDEYRKGLCNDLGFSREDRNTNIRRLGFVGKILARNGVIVIMATINPYEDVRKELKGDGAKTVYVDCDLTTLQKRDPKGLYKRALLPDNHPDKVRNFTGISDPFDEPEDPDLTLYTMSETLEVSVNILYTFILQNIY